MNRETVPFLGTSAWGGGHALKAKQLPDNAEDGVPCFAQERLRFLNHISLNGYSFSANAHIQQVRHSKEVRNKGFCPLHLKSAS